MLRFAAYPAGLLRAVLALHCALVPCLSHAAAPDVTNVRASQRAGAKLVDIWYDVSDADGDPLSVSVQVRVAGSPIAATSFSGAGYGTGVTPGNNRHVVWDAGADWDGQYSDQVTFVVTADDGTSGPIPPDMVLIPAGSFSMGDSFSEGGSYERPVHTVYVSAFYMDRDEVTNDKMVQVLQWAYGQGKLTVTSESVRNAQGNSQELLDLDDSDCRITWNGSQFGMKAAKGSGYPCVEVTWYGAVAYCNYLSEQEGRTPCYDLSDWSCNWSANGYRLPTEAEWEKAARGGAAGRRFPWSDSDTIQHARANYYSSSSYSYDTSPTQGYHPTYDDGLDPYTSPVGVFAANGYGLRDMAGNVWEWCWDWYGSSYYGSSPGSDPRGPATGSNRVIRGGGWYGYANGCRVAFRSLDYPGISNNLIGFRAVLPPGQ